MTRVLIAGESWISEATHYKGFDSFTTVTFHTGVGPLREALTVGGHEVTYMPAHEVPEAFPDSPDALSAHDVVILSDIGANSLLLHPATWLEGRRRPHRLRVLADWVRAGGGLMMAGGYLSFQGFEAKAQFRGTAVDDVLPSIIQPHDDRVEEPEGVEPQLASPNHPITRDLDPTWPALLGYNRFALKDDATLLARLGPDPLLAVRHAEKGRTLVWASDVGPHWCPAEFTSWPGFATLMNRSVKWLASTLQPD